MYFWNFFSSCKEKESKDSLKSRRKIFNIIWIKIYLKIVESLKLNIITIKDLQFDISFSHMRYNKTAVDVIFKPETFKFSILRNPIEQFLSSYLYYRNWTNSLTSKILGKDGILHINSELERFLKVAIFYILRKIFQKKTHNWKIFQNPWKYLDQIPYEFTRDLIVNPQMVYFGYPSGLIGEFSVDKNKIVDQWITDIDRQFGFIMIMEHFDLSLAVLVGIFFF